MSHEELDRFGVITRVRERRPTQEQAARMLGLGVRHAQRPCAADASASPAFQACARRSTDSRTALTAEVSSLGEALHTRASPRQSVTSGSAIALPAQRERDAAGAPFLTTLLSASLDQVQSLCRTPVGGPAMQGMALRYS